VFSLSTALTSAELGVRRKEQLGATNHRWDLTHQVTAFVKFETVILGQSFREIGRGMTGISPTLIEVANTSSKMSLSPIERSWIIEGEPVAELSILSKSADSRAWTVVWQCSAGKFNWYYDYDETILILDGSIVIEAEGMPPASYKPGDVIFFKEGAHAIWHVENSVRKIAFCRRTNPDFLNFAVRVVSKIKRILTPAQQQKAANLLG
jgi:uncharacterized protein